MSAAEIIRRAEADGLMFVLVGRKLRLQGRKQAVAQWLPIVQTHKPEIVEFVRSRSRSVADRYYRHHFSCQFCIAAGANPTLRRCATGMALWERHLAASEVTS
jgi:hypothetical protein